MESAGLNPANIQAFLHQYKKLQNTDAGLVSEASIDAVINLPSIQNHHSEDISSAAADSTVVLKLNGGLGTSMGLDKAKSLLRVRDELTFIDIIVRQILTLRTRAAPEVKLLFMNSFSTSEDTLAWLSRYPELGLPKTLELLQNKVPKIEVESLVPIEWPSSPALEWCPPGHGDIYASLIGSGLLENLLATGKQFLFVSNVDNLGATLEGELLRFFAESDAPFMMEVTRRTGADRKGGHLAIRKSDGRYVLRESAQTSEEDMDAFQNVDKHSYFNTNNLWIRLDALWRELNRRKGLLPLPLIRNTKTVDPRDKTTPKVYQLETAMGSAIECFEGAAAVEVPRSRFSPVKTTADLLAVRSDAYQLDLEFRLGLCPARNGVPPIINLDECYRMVEQLEELVRNGVPSLVDCRTLTIEGAVQFERGVRIIGEVTIVNRNPETFVVPAGSYKDEKLSNQNGV